MNVSIIIPAYNAADTLAHTLDSLLAQTIVNWETIIVDDGSSDGTSKIAESYAGRDMRFRLVSQDNAGVAAARNRGIALARFDWLLFLDSDDWILPHYVERMTGKLQSDTTLDAVHCGFRRVAINGKLGPEVYAPRTTDLFPNLACMCSFPTHSLVIRKSLILALDGFDVYLENCEDWDLWQQIARSGAFFGAVHEALARYRTSPKSRSRKTASTLASGLRIINRGHSRDERVKNPVQEHAEGRPKKGLSSARIYFTIWPAALMLGSGQDARPLLDAVREDRDPGLDPDRVAAIIYEAALLPEGLPPDSWHEMWLKIQPYTTLFLDKLEEQSMAAGLAHRALRFLELLILEHPRGSGPRSVGDTYIVEIEVSEPINDIIPPNGVKRIYCIILLEGEKLGHITLPIIEGTASSYVLVDAIAHKFAWSILGRFLMHTLSGNLRTEHSPTGLSLYRGDFCLASGLHEDESQLWSKTYEESGWLIFLQEVWGKPDWPKDSFYDQNIKNGSGETLIADNGWLVVEVSQSLPNVKVTGQELNVLFTVGGVSIGVVTISDRNRTIHAQELRVALNSESGSELLIAAVREVLIGRKLIGSATFRERLAKAAKQNNKVPSHELSNEINLPTGASSMLYKTLDPTGYTVLIGRWYSGAMTSTISRRAILPAESAKGLIDAASIDGQPVIHYSQNTTPPKLLVYAPDMILPKSDNAASFVIRNSQSNRITEKQNKLKNNPEPVITERLPILVYNQITPDGSGPYQLAPEAFEEQLRYLSEAGYYSVNLGELHSAMHSKTPLPGKAVIITFDKGHLDFITYAWPLLKRYGFSAIVFLSTNDVDNPESPDNTSKNNLNMLDWKQVRQLSEEEVEFGSYFSLNQPLSMLSYAEIVKESIRSRTIIEWETKKPIHAIAYPFVTVNDSIQYQPLAEDTTGHLIGSCGYLFGLTQNRGFAGLWDNPMALPRMGIRADETIEDFISKLNK